MGGAKLNAAHTAGLCVTCVNVFAFNMPFAYWLVHKA